VACLSSSSCSTTLSPKSASRSGSPFSSCARRRTRNCWLAGWLAGRQAASDLAPYAVRLLLLGHDRCARRVACVQGVLALGWLAAHNPECRDHLLHHRVVPALLHISGNVTDLEVAKALSWTFSILCGVTHPRSKLPSWEAVPRSPHPTPLCHSPTSPRAPSKCVSPPLSLSLSCRVVCASCVRRVCVCVVCVCRVVVFTRVRACCWRGEDRTDAAAPGQLFVFGG
jgi:hypothetical protein